MHGLAIIRNCWIKQMMIPISYQ